MKANIKTYKTNAYLFVDEKSYTIEWDGLEFDNEEEYYGWITEVMEPAMGCSNYEEVKLSLEIATDYMRPIRSNYQIRK